MKQSWKRMGAFSGILGGLMFVVVTFVNMAIYPGGYVFLEDYFSELGLMEVNGQSNVIGYVLFSLACTSAAVCSVPFCLSMRTFFTETRLLKCISWVATLAGLASAPFLSALALFAGDVYPLQHILCTILFFVLYPSAVVIYSIAILLNKEYNRFYAVPGFLAASLALLHIFWLLTAPMQKLAVYALVLWSAIQGYRLLQILGQSETGHHDTRV